MIRFLVLSLSLIFSVSASADSSYPFPAKSVRFVDLETGAPIVGKSVTAYYEYSYPALLCMSLFESCLGGGVLGSEGKLVEFGEEHLELRTDANGEIQLPAVELVTEHWISTQPQVSFQLRGVRCGNRSQSQHPGECWATIRLPILQIQGVSEVRLPLLRKD